MKCSAVPEAQKRKGEEMGGDVKGKKLWEVTTTYPGNELTLRSATIVRETDRRYYTDVAMLDSTVVNSDKFAGQHVRQYVAKSSRTIRWSPEEALGKFLKAQQAVIERQRKNLETSEAACAWAEAQLKGRNREEESRRDFNTGPGPDEMEG